MEGNNKQYFKWMRIKMTAAENRRRQGREAFLDGKQLFDNPYKQFIASRYEDWKEGWLDAEREKLEKQIADLCKDIRISARTEAKWTNIPCPKCRKSFVAKDDHGLYCCVDECEWTEQNWGLDD